MREARAALGLGCCVQLVQRSGKGSGFLGGEHIGQVFVKGRFDLCLGGSQAFRLFGGVQQLAAPVAGGISADQKTLCFQIFCPPRNGSLICVQQFRQLRLRAAGISLFGFGEDL